MQINLSTKNPAGQYRSSYLMMLISAILTGVLFILQNLPSELAGAKWVAVAMLVISTFLNIIKQPKPNGSEVKP